MHHTINKSPLMPWMNTLPSLLRSFKANFTFFENYIYYHSVFYFLLLIGLLFSQWNFQKLNHWPLSQLMTIQLWKSNKKPETRKQNVFLSSGDLISQNLFMVIHSNMYRLPWAMGKDHITSIPTGWNGPFTFISCKVN